MFVRRPQERNSQKTSKRNSVQYKRPQKEIKKDHTFCINKFHSRQQAENEQLTHYLFEMKYLADNGSPHMAFNDFLTTAIQGMLKHNIFDFARHPITSFQELVEQAMIHERTKQMTQKRTECRPISPLLP